MLSQFRHLIVGSVLLLIGCTVASAQFNGSNGYNAYNIMAALSQRHSDLVMVAAHRGLHAILGTNSYSDTPENSLQSIYNAVTAGVEIIELDVRLTQDGVPVLSHDSTWGRETNVGNNWGACCFSPWGPLPGLSVPDGDPGELGGGVDSPSDPERSVNPNVSDWALHSVQQDGGGIKLRNSTNFQWSTWAENPPTLQNALDYIRTNRWAVVLALDIKDPNSFQAAWNVVARNQDFNNRLYNATVFFKFDAAWNFPYPGNFESYFSAHTVSPGFPDWSYMNIMPVYQTSGIASNLYGSEDNELYALVSYNAKPYVVGQEVNLKQNPGILSSLYNWGDTVTPKALGNFNPYGEWINPEDPNQTYQFFFSNGYCCATLDQYFYYGGLDSGRPSDTDDQRWDWNFILANRNGFNLITTDNPLAMGYYLWNRGQRNTSYFY